MDPDIPAPFQRYSRRAVRVSANAIWLSAEIVFASLFARIWFFITSNLVEIVVVNWLGVLDMKTAFQIIKQGCYLCGVMCVAHAPWYQALYICIHFYRSTAAEA